MTRKEAEEHIKEHFEKGETKASPNLRSTCQTWSEFWVRKDAQPVTEDDREAFQAVPRGQGHVVKVDGPTVTLHCTLDSGG